MATPPHAGSITVRERLRARALRMASIRRRVAAVALCAFVLTWGLIYTGGSMGAQTSSTVSSSRLAGTSGASSTSTSSGSSADSSSTSSPAPTPVTTSQS